MMTASPLLDELRRMPIDRLEETAAFIGVLVAERHQRRNAMIDATAGSLAGTVGEALAAALDDCERIDENA